MKSIEKEKMCVNCEGRIAYNADICPYCASYQKTNPIQNSFQAPIFENQSLEDSLTSLYTPPYQGKQPNFQRQEEFSEPMQNAYKEVREKPLLDPLLGAIVEEEKPVQKSSAIPTFMLTLGANIGVIGLMQLFFSKNGILRLEWDANYWFFYCLVSAPLIYFGLKKLKSI